MEHTYERVLVLYLVPGTWYHSRYHTRQDTINLEEILSMLNKLATPEVANGASDGDGNGDSNTNNSNTK